MLWGKIKANANVSRQGPLERWHWNWDLEKEANHEKNGEKHSRQKGQHVQMSCTEVGLSRCSPGAKKKAYEAQWAMHRESK